MNWDDPVDRYNLIERVGADEYERLHKAHMQACTVAKVYGHDIRTLNTRFGRLYAVGTTGKAFATLEQAKAFAKGGV